MPQPDAPTRPAPLSEAGQQAAARRKSLQALWFDGRRSKPHAAWVTVQAGPRGPSLTVRPMDGATASLHLSTQQVRWPESWRANQGHAQSQQALLVDLGEHGSLEVLDGPAWQAAVLAAGGRPNLAARMQTSWPTLLLACGVAVCALWAFYRFGTPWAATQLARFVPLSMEEQISQQYLAQLDERLLKPSSLPPARQQQLRQGFDELVRQLDPAQMRYPHYRPKYRLEFRKGMGPNAFALPGGTIVMTDDIVKEAQGLKLPDDALIGVLAHEIGHVADRHTSRTVLQQGVLQTGMALALGDVSSVLATAATALTSLSYSRSHETEADCFALALMQRMGKPTRPMGDLLLGLDSGISLEEIGAEIAQRTGMASEPASSPAPTHPPKERTEHQPRDINDSGSDWYSTHPDTAARARLLRDGSSPQCRQ